MNLFQNSGRAKTGMLAAALVIIATLSAFGAGRAESRGLTVALSGNPDTLDPHKTSGTLTFQTLKSVYDTLVEPDQEGRIVPALAESWEISDDGLLWTFRLRSGVVFHNGDRFTSADVKATLERILDPATASPWASEFSSITAVETPDELTAVIRLSRPYAPLLASLASGWGAILPEELIDAGHDFASRPVGTGPFSLEEWVRDNSLTLRKNPEYWMEGLPKEEELRLQIIPEASVQVQGLLTGSLDIIDWVTEENLPLLEENQEVRYETLMTSLVMVMAMNTSRPGLDSLPVRQAVNHAIDKQQVLDVAYGGGEVVGTFMDYSDPYYQDFTGLYPFDPVRAEELIEKAGAAADREYEMVLPQNYYLHVKAGEIYQEMLSDAGLNVKIRLVDWSTWLSDVYQGGKYDFTVIGHTGKLDPDGRLTDFTNGKNYVRWLNPEAAELIEQARRVNGYENRKPLYDRVLEIMAREVPFVYTGTSYRYVGMRNSVNGFRMTPKLDTYDFRWCEKQ